jgi:uncharacterized protein
MIGEMKTNATKLTNKSVTRFDKGIIGNDVFMTDEGYIKGRCIVTRCGVFLYKNADGSVRKELRHPDDVQDPFSLETIKMIPVVDGHPTEKLVNADNAKKLSVGYTGELVEDEYPNIISNLVITDKATVAKIKGKKKNQLSLGYTVDLIPESGTYHGEPYDFKQTNIRYNHLALVDEARAGPEAKIVLDGNDAESVEIFKMGAEMAKEKKMRKVKFDDTHEYMVDDEVGEHMEKMMSHKMKLEEEKEALEKQIEKLENDLDRAHAERDSMRDKDHHDPKAVHEPLSGEHSETDHDMPGEEGYEKEHAHMEKDEIGPNGKEKIDPFDSYGMQSHVRDYEKPSHMRNHVVSDPKNKHYPHDLPHVAKVDAAEFKKAVQRRVKLVSLCNKYLDKQTLTRVDSLSDIELKKKLILSIQKNAQLEGKSDAYINARFDAVIEEMPKANVIATPSRMDSNAERESADADQARRAMIDRQRNAYKTTGYRR